MRPYDTTTARAAAKPTLIARTLPTMHAITRISRISRNNAVHISRPPNLLRSGSSDLIAPMQPKLHQQR